MKKHKTIWSEISKSRLMPVGVIVLVTLLFGTVLYAGADSSFKGLVADAYGKYLADKTEAINTSGDVMLGADIGDSTYLTDKRPGVVVPFENVWIENDLEVGKSVYFNGTTTIQSSYYAAVDTFDLTGTSTAKGATQNVISYYTNTGAEKIVKWVGFDVQTALGAFDASFQCGTSTWVGGVAGVSLTSTTSASVIASSTISSTFTTTNSVNGLRDNSAYPGSFYTLNSYGTPTSTAFVLKNNEVLYCTWTPYGATSSASFTSAGGFTGVGQMLIDFLIR